MPIEAAQVHVGDGHQVERRVLGKRVDVRQRLAAGAEAGVTHHRVWARAGIQK